MSRDMTAAEALEWAANYIHPDRGVWSSHSLSTQLDAAEKYRSRAAELRAQASRAQEPVAVYEADTDHLKELQDRDMAKGWRWNRKDFRRGDKLYLAPPADERVKELEGLLREALPKIGERSVLQMQRGEVTIYERIRAALEGDDGIYRQIHRF